MHGLWTTTGVLRRNMNQAQVALFVQEGGFGTLYWMVLFFQDTAEKQDAQEPRNKNSPGRS